MKSKKINKNTVFVRKHIASTIRYDKVVSFYVKRLAYLLDFLQSFLKSREFDYMSQEEYIRTYQETVFDIRDCYTHIHFELTRPGFISEEDDDFDLPF